MTHKGIEYEKKLMQCYPLLTHAGFLGRCMKKLMVLALVALAVQSAWSAWDQVATSQRGTIYIDPSSVLKSDSHVRVRTLFDLKKPGKDGALSSQSDEEIDCQVRNVRTRHLVVFDGKMGRGNELFSGALPATSKPISPGSTLDAVSKRVCDQ